MHLAPVDLLASSHKLSQLTEDINLISSLLDTKRIDAGTAVAVLDHRVNYLRWVEGELCGILLLERVPIVLIGMDPNGCRCWAVFERWEDAHEFLTHMDGSMPIVGQAGCTEVLGRWSHEEEEENGRSVVVDGI